MANVKEQSWLFFKSRDWRPMTSYPVESFKESKTTKIKNDWYKGKMTEEGVSQLFHLWEAAGTKVYLLSSRWHISQEQVHLLSCADRKDLVIKNGTIYHGYLDISVCVSTHGFTLDVCSGQSIVMQKWARQDHRKHEAQGNLLLVKCHCITQGSNVIVKSLRRYSQVDFLYQITWL